MRCLVGFVCVLGLVPSPVSVSAQDNEAGTTSEPSPEESAPPSEPALEEPALQLQLDDSGVGVVPPPQRTPDGYTLEEMELRAKRAKIGLGVSAASLVVGGVLVGVAIPNLTCAEGLSGGSGNCPIPGWSLPVFVTGVTLAGGGVLGLITAGSRKRTMANHATFNGFSHNLESSSDPRSARLRSSRSNATRSFSLKQRSYRGCV